MLIWKSHMRNTIKLFSWITWTFITTYTALSTGVWKSLILLWNLWTLPTQTVTYWRRLCVCVVMDQTRLSHIKIIKCSCGCGISKQRLLLFGGSDSIREEFHNNSFVQRSASTLMLHIHCLGSTGCVIHTEQGIFGTTTTRWLAQDRLRLPKRS